MAEFVINTFETWCQPVVVNAQDIDEAIQFAVSGDGDDTSYAPIYIDRNDYEIRRSDVQLLKGCKDTTRVQQLLSDFAAYKHQLTEEQRQQLLGDLTLRWVLEDVSRG